ncbi:MAG: hypothetical protein M5T61_19090 [Acidimicrobiia bacterium]|nr:hypothetical protein [Acidimicrobiia bacterium]
MPESEVDQAVAEAFATWDVWRMYADPPYWEMSLDRWAAQYGKDRIVPWWTNRIKVMAFALRAFQTDMRPEAMSHDGDPLLPGTSRTLFGSARGCATVTRSSG